MLTARVTCSSSAGEQMVPTGVATAEEHGGVTVSVGVGRGILSCMGTDVPRGVAGLVGVMVTEDEAERVVFAEVAVPGRLGILSLTSSDGGDSVTGGVVCGNGVSVSAHSAFSNSSLSDLSLSSFSFSLCSLRFLIQARPLPSSSSSFAAGLATPGAAAAVAEVPCSRSHLL